MCDCENMTASLREKKIAEFFESVIKRHADENGKVDFDKLDIILTSLGRRVSGERIVKLRKKFDTENTGKISHNDPDLILAIASINVVDVSAIDDDVLNTAFKTFDLVKIDTHTKDVSNKIRLRKYLYWKKGGHKA